MTTQSPPLPNTGPPRISKILENLDQDSSNMMISGEPTRPILLSYPNASATNDSKMSAMIRRKGPRKLSSDRDEDQRFAAAGALTMLFKAVDEPEDGLKKPPKSTGPIPRDLAEMLSVLPDKRKQAVLQQMTIPENVMMQHRQPKSTDNPNEQVSRQQQKKRNFIATLSKPPTIAHVPGNALFRRPNPPIMQQRNPGPPMAQPPMASRSGSSGMPSQRQQEQQQMVPQGGPMVSLQQRGLPRNVPDMMPRNYAVSEGPKNSSGGSYKQPGNSYYSSAAAVAAAAAAAASQQVSITSESNPKDQTGLAFTPNKPGNGYFFGEIASHSGTNRMNSLGIPTLLVHLPRPQMHLTGFVVAGHVAWQSLGNSADNWSIARCLMCVRYPNALELMICDPTTIFPAIQHVYICPSHCVRRFQPNLPGLKQQLKMDMISLPLSKPPAPFTGTGGRANTMPMVASAPPPQNSQQLNLSKLPLPVDHRKNNAMGVAVVPGHTPDNTPAGLGVGGPYGLIGLNQVPKQISNQTLRQMYMAKVPENKEFRCNQCNKDFSCKSSLNRHMRIHSGIKPFQCPTCGKKFADKGVLDVHTRIHSGKKPYHCKECLKGFSQKGNLKRHMRIHSGVRPYSCNICQKSFSQKGHLTAHLRIHTGQKPYTCVFCQKSFTQSSTLIGHMRTHTGERPFSCELCGKSFRQRWNLTAHMQMHKEKNNGVGRQTTTGSSVQVSTKPASAAATSSQ